MYTDNKVWSFRFFENYAGYMIDIGVLSVDTFFVSSGCLVTYLYLKNETNKQLTKPINCREKLIDFFINIIKRFVRYIFRLIYANEKDNKRNKIITYNNENKKKWF